MGAKSVFDMVARNISDSRSKRNIGIAAVGAGTVLAPQESEASVAKLAARGMELVPNIDPEDTRVGEYYLKKGGDTKSIGSLKTDYALDSGFGDGYMASDNTEIAAEYRRRGLAGEMYDAAQEISGNQLVPSTFLSPDGAAMWNSRDRPLLEQVQQNMEPDNYDTVEDVLYPDGRPHPDAVKLAATATAGGAGAYAAASNHPAYSHPGDGALDTNALALVPEMISATVNDIYKYGKQLVTGEQSDEKLMPFPDTTDGDAQKIKDAVATAADWVLNYKNEGFLMPEGGASVMDGITAAVSAYQESVRPVLQDALGEEGALRFEATGVLAATLFPGKNAGKLASTSGDLPSIRTREEVEASASPDYGPVVQTRAAGESVDVPALEMQTAKGYPENPNVPMLLEGGYGDSVPKSQVTKNRNKYENSPLFREMQDARADGGRFTATEDLFSQSAKYEDLVDKPLINIPADPTAVGMVDRLGGVDIEPMNLDGGPLFTDRYGSWMSMETAAKAKQRHALRVADETGQLPVGLYHNMKHEGSNFSTMPSEAILRYIDAQGGLDIEGMRFFDNLMSSKPNNGDLKGISADWPGWESTDQVRGWLMRNDPLGNSSSGNRRKAFVPSMMGVDMQNYGILPPNDLYAPINEQVMRNVQAGSVGMRGGQFTDIQPGDMQTIEGLHPSYNTVIPFSNTISLDQPMVPWNVLFKDAADARVGKPAHNAARSFQTSGSDYQMFREEDLNRVNQYIENLPKLK
ncbi:hypothetical protein N8303_07060 [Gammaproteobacteria bacterium]|nr:hypothetical protein [Gammaproteobacteria bacterium]